MVMLGCGSDAGGDKGADPGENSAGANDAGGGDAASDTGGADGGNTGPDSGGDGIDGGGGTPEGAPRYLLVATSYVPRRVSLATGATEEILGNRLRWQQSPGHLYQHWDVSPDGKSIAVYHEYGTNAPATDDRLVLYSFDDPSTGKVLLEADGPVGSFPVAPCFVDASTLYVVSTGPGSPGGVWKVDPTSDAAQTPTLVVAIDQQDKMNGPIYWNRDCSAFVTQGFRSGGTNEDSTNVAWFDVASGKLTQISEHAVPGAKTLAQQENYASCGNSCTIARNGGTTEKMGFLADGSIWFTSNRDVFRDNKGASQGAEQILVFNPKSPAAFADLTALSGSAARAISRDGAYTAVLNGESVEVLDDDGMRVVLSEAAFNAANGAGFMRFVP